MLFKTLFLILPAVALARIQIRVNAGSNQQGSSVDIAGNNVDIISDVERRTFDITDGPLRDAATIFSGGRPRDVFVRSPTPWNDLYVTYGWSQVHRTLFPVNARIRSIRSEPLIVARQTFINNSSFKGTYDANITHSVEQSVSTTWSKNFELSVEQSISYSFGFGIGGSTSFTFASSWGQATTKMETVTIGSSSGVSVELGSRESVLVTLMASKAVMEIEVEYNATLNGFVACYYPNGCNGYHFWAYHVNNVLHASGKQRQKTSREVLTVDYYTEVRVILDVRIAR